MRYSELFGKTRRDAPVEISDPARRLAFRAGLLRQLDAGTLAFLPLAGRTLARMEAWIRNDLRQWNAQELRVATRPNLSTLAGQEVQSYKHLPARLFWLDEGGMRLHLASLELSRAAAEEMALWFERFLHRLAEFAGLQVKTAEHLDSSRAWYVAAESGDLEVLRCTSGDYAATRAAARRLKPVVDAEQPLPLEEVETLHCDTIDTLAQFLGVPTSRTAKAVFYASDASDGQVIFAVVRGDLNIDEEKLKRALGVNTLRFATDSEIQRVGATPGYASPVGVRGARIIVDDSIANSPNLVAGANREGYHLRNTNVPRDYTPELVADIALTRAGDTCPNGDGTLELVRGIQIGATHGPDELAASYLDANGRAQKMVSVQVEVDLANTLLAFVAEHHDDKGILWSRELAPYAVHLVALNADKPDVTAALARVTAELEQAGIEYLLDDRAESAGVKFNDADLIGLPARITLGPRTVAQNGAEFKRRAEKEARVIRLDQVVAEVQG